MTCGIYLIKNNITGKMYVGQSIHIEERIRQHQYKRDNVNSHIDNSIAKYGWDNFTWQILHECKMEDLDIEERKFINLYGTYSNGYNLTRGGDLHGCGNPMHNPVLKQKNADARRGFKQSYETKIEMSKKANSTGFYRVMKEYSSQLQQGFTYRYEIRREHVTIRATDINMLEYKVKRQGHDWIIINQELAEQTIIESEKCRLSKENSHPTGFFRVIKHKDKSANLGFFYRYSYPKENGKRGYIENKSLEVLKNKVLAMGLIWIEFDTPDNCIGGRMSSLDEWC